MEVSLTRKEPGLAALMSLFIGGAGQLYCGKFERGIIFIIIDIFLWFTVVGAILFGIVAAVDAYNIAKEINSKIDAKEKRDRDDEAAAVEQMRLAQVRSGKEIDSVKFAERIKKNYKLFTSEIYTEEEFNRNKDLIILELAEKDLSCDKEEFLGALIGLKEQGIINAEDINKIKRLIM